MNLESDEMLFRSVVLPMVNDIDLQSIIGNTGDFTDVNSDCGEQNICGLPGAYRTVYGNVSKLADLRIVDQWRTVNCVIPERNFVGNSCNCLGAIAETIFLPSFDQNKYVLENYSVERSESVFQIFNLETGVLADNVFDGIVYTKSSLENGKPIVFGVNSMPVTTMDNWDGCTNSYLLIVGMGNDGRNYFYAWDNSTPNAAPHVDNGVNYEGGTSQLNKLYFDSDWPGLLRADSKWNNVYSAVRQAYKVTQIIKTKKVFAY